MAYTFSLIIEEEGKGRGEITHSKTALKYSKIMFLKYKQKQKQKHSQSAQWKDCESLPVPSTLLLWMFPPFIEQVELFQMRYF